MKNKLTNMFVLVLVISLLVMTSCSYMAKPINVYKDSAENRDLTDLENNADDSTSGENAFADCIGMASKLDSCSAFQCSFTHPFDGQEYTRTIFGIVNGKCKYVETMPNGGQMECNYAESMRKAVAKQYQLYEDNPDATYGMSGDLLSGEFTYTIDGVEVEDPLSVAMSDGTCIITGY
ncbi:MAG: hypothetical protein PHU51_01190 [Candidatus Nanoarchaeia archaeon]|nr:hypothetical protein [Candidatus Nanoarchaeia archaeon]